MSSSGESSQQSPGGVAAVLRLNHVPAVYSWGPSRHGGGPAPLRPPSPWASLFPRRVHVTRAQLERLSAPDSRFGLCCLPEQKRRLPVRPAPRRSERRNAGASALPGGRRLTAQACGAPRAEPAWPAQSLGLEPPPFTPPNNPPAPSPGRLRAEKRPLARVLPLTAPGPAARVPAPRRGAGGTRHTSLRGCELADTGHAPSCDQCPYETAQ